MILALSVRGLVGVPDAEELNAPVWKENGPLELSPERGRFALTYSIVEDVSFQFSLPVARFVTPDLGYKNSKFVSLFAPGISFLTAPGYILGKTLGSSQVGTFAEISLFGLMNALLVFLISRKLGANSVSSGIGALLFLFATPAFAYAVTLYQHHVTVFFLLLSILLLVSGEKLWKLFFVWFLIVGSLIIDYPNFFIFFPVGVYALSKFFKLKFENSRLKVNFRVLGVLTFAGAIIPIIFFLWTNKHSYGNYLQLAGTVETVKEIDEAGNPLFKKDLQIRSGQVNLEEGSKNDKNAVGFFKTRHVLNGIYIHLISPERGILFYTPVILFGILGMFLLYKRHPEIAALFLAIIGSNLLLYSMWGDPWGGWAFGSRYLIPLYSIMAIFVAYLLTHFRKKILFILIFFIILCYSVFINTLGALTTNRIPPKGEALALEPITGRKEEYTYKRNWIYLNEVGSKSFVYQRFAKDIFTPQQYYYLVSGIIIFVFLILLTSLYISGKRQKNL